MAKKIPIHPAHPERICWGCDKYCAVDSMGCGSERALHPVELFGDDWLEFGNEAADQANQPTAQDSDNPVAEASPNEIPEGK